jgi:hypothetical protein
MFEKRAVGMATFEFGGCNIDTTDFYKDFFYFFKENCMDVYRITPTGYLHPLPTTGARRAVPDDELRGY